jgi:hypothetical protein
MLTNKQKKYFIVDRYRQGIDLSYAKEFLATKKNIKFFSSFKDANIALQKGFYDDSDYGVFSVNDKNKIVRYEHDGKGFKIT